MHTEKLIQLLQSEFGSRFHDVRHLMPRHRTNHPRPVNFNELIGIAVHHTAYHGMWRQAAVYHVKHHGWPTIAYTVGISYGRVFLLKNVEEMGYHVWGMNEKLLSVVVMGNLTKKEPYIEDIPMLEGVIRCYDAFMGRELQVKGHTDWALPGHGTSCPGPTLRYWARTYQRVMSVRSLEAAELSEEEMPAISSYDISPPILSSMELRGDEPLGGEQHNEKYCFSLGKQGLYVWSKESNEVMLLAGEKVMGEE
jgi:hypothetical protein